MLYSHRERRCIKTGGDCENDYNRCLAGPDCEALVYAFQYYPLFRVEDIEEQGGEFVADADLEVIEGY